MAKIVGIDFGSKRTGIAMSDELAMIASPLETIHTSELLSYLLEKKKEGIDEVVMGLPKGLKGEDTDATRQVLDFEKHVKRSIPGMLIHLVDERFTSKLAMQAMVSGNVPKSKRREKGMIDKISAAIILQSFLDNRSR